MFRAEPFAFFASDTSIATHTAGIGTLVTVLTHHGNVCLFGHHGDNMLGANGGAHAASETA